jgi:hypothetical protein
MTTNIAEIQSIDPVRVGWFTHLRRALAQAAAYALFFFLLQFLFPEIAPFTGERAALLTCAVAVGLGVLTAGLLAYALEPVYRLDERGVTIRRQVGVDHFIAWDNVQRVVVPEHRLVRHLRMPVFPVVRLSGTHTVANAGGPERMTQATTAVKLRKFNDPDLARRFFFRHIPADVMEASGIPHKQPMKS